MRLLFALLAFAVSCGVEEPETAFELELPQGFPRLRVPAENTLTEPKIKLGRHLFYDTRLSLDQTLSCATCHKQDLAFTDGRATAVGVTGEVHPRSAMTLANVAYAATLNWANPIEHQLEKQALTPLFGETPIEHGLSGREDVVLAALREDSVTLARFEQAFPDDSNPVSILNLARALASFQRTLISGNSPYDQYVRGQSAAISERAKRGRDLFFSERLECFHCHGGFNFSQGVDHEAMVFSEPQFHNNGLYNIDNVGDYPEDNQGLYVFTGRPEDRGRFKPPTLRNIALTAPYMHDGSIPTLSEVIDHYAAGGREITEGPFQGDGRKNPNKSTFVTGFFITENEKEDLLEFLNSLTDEEFVTNPAFGPP